MKRDDAAMARAAEALGEALAGRGIEREGCDLSAGEKAQMGGDPLLRAYQAARGVALKARLALNLALSQGLPCIQMTSGGNVDVQALTAHGVVTRRVNALLMANAALGEAARNLRDDLDADVGPDLITHEVLL